MAGGRTTKYTPETVEKILTVIRQTGILREGCKAGSISTSTFHDWINKFSEFSEAVSNALDEYSERNPDEMLRLAKASLLEYLLDRKKDHWKTQRSRVIYRYKLNSETGKYEKYPFEEHIETESKSIRRACPTAILERVLGKSMPTMDALKQLVSDGTLDDAHSKVIADAIANLDKEIKSGFEQLRSQSNGSSN